MDTWLHIGWDLANLACAALIGAAIGFEREAHGQAAGLRTNILVCVGSCLLMMLSLHMVELHQHLSGIQSVVRLDPARIASYAIASMGFLGAGAIITGKGSVRGLTTAAGLWLVTGLGLAIGAGYLLQAAFTTIISLVILYALRRVKKLIPQDEHTLLTLKYSHLMEKPLDRIKQILAEHRVSIQFVNYKLEMPTNMTTYRLRLQSKDNLTWGNIVKTISQTKGLEEINWQEGEVP